MGGRAWLEFLGVVLVGGMLAFRALLWAPVARTFGDDAPSDELVGIWVVAGAALALHAGVLAFLTSAYKIVGGSFLDFVHVQFQTIRASTPFGQAWTVTSFAWLGVIALLVAAWVTPRRREALLASGSRSA